MNRLRFIGLFLVAIVFVACRTADPVSQPEGTVTAGEEPSFVATLLSDLPPAQPDLESFPVTIENCDRTLTFNQPPQRTVSLWQPPNEMLLALGIQEQLIGLAGNYTDLPPALAPVADSIPSLGSGMRWPPREILLSLNPDLVVSEGLDGFAFDPAQGYATVTELTEAGVQVVSTGSSCNPGEALTRGIDVVYDDLQMLATIFGVPDRGSALVEKLQQQQTEILQTVEGLPTVPTIFYNGGEGPLSVLNAGVWGDAVRQAGGDSIFDQTIFQVGLEEFANSNADVILMGTYPGQDADMLKTFLTDTFPNLPAVQNGRLYPIPTIEPEASILIVDCLDKHARALHPEAFE